MQTIESQVGTEGWPAEVLALFESIEHAFPPVMQRRQVARTPYKREGHFTLTGEGQSFAVYTRDANLWTVGFIAGRRIETNARGVLKLIAPDGAEHEMRCRVIRSREIRPGWFDVGVEFPTDEGFAEDRILGH